MTTMHIAMIIVPLIAASILWKIIKWYAFLVAVSLMAIIYFFVLPAATGTVQ